MAKGPSSVILTGNRRTTKGFLWSVFAQQPSVTCPSSPHGVPVHSLTVGTGGDGRPESGHFCGNWPLICTSVRSPLPHLSFLSFSSLLISHQRCSPIFLRDRPHTATHDQDIERKQALEIGRHLVQNHATPLSWANLRRQSCPTKTTEAPQTMLELPL